MVSNFTPPATGGNYLPTLAERLTPSVERFDRQLAQIFQLLRVSLPGVITQFNAGPPQTVQVQVATKEFVQQNTGGDQISLETDAIALGLLNDVPLYLYGGGGWTLTTPVQVGDECIVLFADTMLDVWFQNGAQGGPVAPQSLRRHSLSDAIAFVGIRSTPRGLENYSTSSAQLRSDDGSVIIDLTLDGVTVTAPKVTVTTTGDVDVNASGDVNVTATGTVAIQSGGGHNTTIDGIAFKPHEHTGVTSGGSNTGPVV